MRLSSAGAIWNKFKKIRPSYTLLAFLIPFFSFLMVMLIGQYEPFGNERSMLYSDMYHQYFPFFVNFRKNILEGNSLLYNWDIGMGLDYLGLYSYYLASPLNLLSLLVPESLLLEYFALLAPLKLGFASLFFALFLKKACSQNDLSISLFGSLYGLCAWSLGYHWNVMWLDAFALLPLVVLGMVSLLKERRFILYTLSLFLCIFANYYVGFFVCIFIFLGFWIYEICRFGGFKMLAIDFGLIALFTVLAIGMTAILELPTLSALQTTQSSSDQVRTSFAPPAVNRELTEEFNEVYQKYEAAKEAGKTIESLKYRAKAFGIGFQKLTLNIPSTTQNKEIADSHAEAYAQYCAAKAAGDKEAAREYWWKAFGIGFKAIGTGMRMVASNMGGGVVPNFKAAEAMPNIYCGVLSILLALMFLFNGRIRIRDKICSLLLLIFLIVSFIVRQLDYLWHGFHFPNMIPYRFSFLYCFVLLYMAFRAWQNRNAFRLWHFVAAGSICLVLFLGAGKTEDFVYLAYNLVFLVLYMAALLLPMFQRKLSPDATEEESEYHDRVRKFNLRASTISVFVILALELIFNTVNFGVNFPYTGSTSYPNYPEGNQNTLSIVKHMQSQDDELFYRAEVTHAQTLNDAALAGYSGLSTFTSSANVHVTEFMSDLGASALNTYNRYCYEKSSPVSNLFLGLKYHIDREVPVDQDWFKRLDNADNRRDHMGSDPYFTNIAQSGGVYLYRNNYYLPLGFLVDPGITTLNFDLIGDDFSFQNRLIKLSTGLSGNVWETMTKANTKITKAGDCEITNSGARSASYKTGSAVGNVVFKYTADHDGYFCFNLSSWYQQEYYSSTRSFVVKINGERLFTDSYSLPQMFGVGYVHEGDVVSIHFICEKEEKGTISVSAGILDDELFSQAYGILNASTLQLTSFESTLVEGTIDCNRDGILYTSIPQNGNWHAYVDGKEVPIQLIGDCMIGIALTKGTHTVTFRYYNPAFELGWKISLICLLIFLTITGLFFLLRKQRKKHDIRREALPEPECATSTPEATTGPNTSKEAPPESECAASTPEAVIGPNASLEGEST